MRTIDLQKFCSVDETRRNILRPWRAGDFTYASDGRIIIRVQAHADDQDNPLGVSITPVCENYCASVTREGQGLAWQKLPELPDVETVPCGICHGNPDHECRCGNVHKCENCDGTGEIQRGGPPIDIGPARFDCHYLRLIADLPGLEIAIRGELDPMMLRFDGGVGVLMPMRKDAPWAERASKT